MLAPIARALGLSLTGECEEGEAFCTWTYDATGNQQLAHVVEWLVGTPLALLGLALIGLLVRWVLHRMIDRLVRRAESGVLPDRLVRGEPPLAGRRVQRAKTMGSLLKSIVTGVVLAVVVTMMLAEMSFNIGPVIASAGIIGVAVGFGAQSLVKDFLSGVFMIFEDQYGVGDVVDLGEASGTVEAVGLRVTRLRDVNGTVWYVRNGEILRVGNMSQNWARTVLDVTVDYREDLVQVRRVLKDVAHELWQDEEFAGVVLEEPEVWGVESLGYEGVVVRVTLKTAPMEQWAVARSLRERIKARFDADGIVMPHPQRSFVVRPDPEPEA